MTHCLLTLLSSCYNPIAFLSIKKNQVHMCPFFVKKNTPARKFCMMLNPLSYPHHVTRKFFAVQQIKSSLPPIVCTMQQKAAQYISPHLRRVPCFTRKATACAFQPYPFGAEPLPPPCSPPCQVE